MKDQSLKQLENLTGEMATEYWRSGAIPPEMENQFSQLSQVVSTNVGRRAPRTKAGITVGGDAFFQALRENGR